MITKDIESEAMKVEVEEQKGIISKLFESIKLKLEDNDQNEDRSLLESLKTAHSELESAELYFQNVTEPDLVDHAIYNMEAAKAKYYYLLKQVRKKKIKANV